MKHPKKDEFHIFQSKVTLRFCASALTAAAITAALYLFLWKQRLGGVVVSALEQLFQTGHESAFLIYHEYFRGNREIFFAAAVILIFLALLFFLFRWISRYFKEINLGIDALLNDDAPPVRLSPEMRPFEQKLNTVKQTLMQRKTETAYAEQRKNELVMHLAHDIRTPLTSIIGYLNLLEEAPDMPQAQRIGHLHLILEKAYRLEQMINEFFEITRYNSQQISLSTEPIDLCYMLIQLTDELSPILHAGGNTVLLNVDESITVCADADKLARVFGNILKNAAAYSDPGTPVTIRAERSDGMIRILFQNQGAVIPKEKLSRLFEKFYRLDDARISDTGGTGLGLAIAREIILLHGGTIEASSEDNTVTFTVCLPAKEEEKHRKT